MATNGLGGLFNIAVQLLRLFGSTKSFVAAYRPAHGSSRFFDVHLSYYASLVYYWHSFPYRMQVSPWVWPLYTYYLESNAESSQLVGWLQL